MWISAWRMGGSRKRGNINREEGMHRLKKETKREKGKRISAGAVKG